MNAIHSLTADSQHLEGICVDNDRDQSISMQFTDLTHSRYCPSPLVSAFSGDEQDMFLGRKRRESSCMLVITNSLHPTASGMGVLIG